MNVNLEALGDLRTPWCLHVVVTLGIAEHLSAGVHKIDDLAVAAQCDAHNLHGVLAHLVTKGVFEQPRPGYFELNEPARELLNPGTRIGLDLNGIGGRMAGVWSTLLSYVRNGSTAYHEAFGMTFWQDLDAHPELAKSFDDLIGRVGHPGPSADIPISGGWSAVRTVVDVGGGTGSMLAAILRAQPHLHGTLVELPRTVERAARIFADAGVTDRVACIGQSFFDPLPAGADVYLLRGVLNNWPDADAIALLKRCAEAAKPAGGRVVILKSVGPDDEPPRLSVDMVLTGGRHRTLEAFTKLAHTAGLEVLPVMPGFVAVECRPI